MYAFAVFVVLVVIECTVPGLRNHLHAGHDDAEWMAMILVTLHFLGTINVRRKK